MIDIALPWRGHTNYISTGEDDQKEINEIYLTFIAVNLKKENSFVIQKKDGIARFNGRLLCESLRIYIV